MLGIDPVIFEIGPLAVRWYGLMYVFGYAFGIIMMKREIVAKRMQISHQQLDSLIFYIMVGMFIGARVFYVFIYNWDHYGSNPTEILAFWRGGLSFHGALLGITIATIIFCRKIQVPFLHVADHMALVAPMGLFFGRVGNFINGELYGRVTNVPWGLVFPEGGSEPRHPSQIYQGLTEGLLLFTILRIFRILENRSKSKRRPGFYLGIFVIGYGAFRLLIENFREPDEQLGYYFGVLTMGQILCVVMILIGIVFLARSKPSTEIHKSAKS